MGLSLLLACGIDPDTLPPADRGPVYARHLAEVDVALARAVDHLADIRTAFARNPDTDYGVDGMMPEFGRLLQAADTAIARFRATRECKGAG